MCVPYVFIYIAMIAVCGLIGQYKFNKSCHSKENKKTITVVLTGKTFLLAQIFGNLNSHPF